MSLIFFRRAYVLSLRILLGIIFSVGIASADTMDAMPSGGVTLLSMDPPREKVQDNTQLILPFCDVALSKPKECYSPRQMIGTPGKLIEGITLTPQIEGKWRLGYNSLVFTPQHPWPAGQDYKVTILQQALPSYVKLQQPSLSFSTEPLQAHIETLRYMQDVNDVSKKFVTSRIHFNYPVDKQSFDQHLFFYKEGEDRALSFTSLMNDQKTEANIEVPIESLGEREQFLRALIREGVKTQDGKAQLRAGPSVPGKNKLEETVLLPSIYSFLKIDSAEINIVKNKQYIPEPLLVVQANAPLSLEQISQHLEVFLLPKDKAIPEASLKKDYDWREMAQITPAILEQSEKVPVTPIPIVGDYASMTSFKLKAPPSRYLLVRIHKGMHSEGGFILEKPYEVVLQIPAFPKEAKIMAEGSLLSLSGEKTLSIFALGLKKLTFEIARIPPENINHLISQTEGQFQNPAFLNEYLFNEYHIAEILQEERLLNAKDDKTPIFLSFDFSRYLEKSLLHRRQGLFLLTIRGSEEDSASSQGNKGDSLIKQDRSALKQILYDRRLILITDMGILVKKNLDKTNDLFALSIAKGVPVTGAKVEVLGINGTPIYTTETDGKGRAKVPDLSGFEKEKRPVAYLMKQGADLTFMPYQRVDRQLNFSRFAVEGTHASQEGLRAYLFSDRGIYRPGETVHIGMIVKDADWHKELEGLPLTLEVMNARGQVIDSKKIAMSREGMMEYSFTTSEEAPTGIYHVSLSLAKGDKKSGHLGSVPVRVEEFLPDKMKITSEFSKKLQGGWVTPEAMKATVTLQHLYGAPASDRRVTAKMTLVPGEFSFPQFKEYYFQADIKPGKSEEVKLREGVTDPEGKVEFPLELERFGHSTYKLTFFAEGYEPDSGRSVKTAKTILVSPRQFIVGTKTNGHLNYIHADDKRSVEFLALNQTLTPVATEELSLDIFRVDHISTLIRRPDGSFGYESKEVEKHLREEAFAIAAKGSSLTLPTKEAGDYAITLSDKAGTILAKVNFTVVGNTNISAAFNRDAALKMTLNKASYSAGEEIQLSLIAPYTGSGLITLETDKIHQFKWFKTTTTSSTHTIKIPKDFEGKGFVNVQFIRALNSPEIYMSPLSYAVQPFVANIDSRDQKITLQVPTQVRPGQEMTIGYRTMYPGKIIISAVDEGILLFGRYKTPNPLDYFIGNRALEVSTAQIFDLILPEYSLLKSLSATGGDGWINEGKNLNPFKRKIEPPVAFWSGILESDREEKQFSVTVPEYFNGGLRVIAVSASPEAVAAAEAETAVKGLMVISPNLPLFAAPGDRFEVPVTVRNHIPGSGKNAKIALKVTTSKQVTLLQSAPALLMIPEGQEQTVKLTFKATDQLGAGSVTFQAGAGDKLAQITSTLSIRPIVPSMEEVKSGYVGKETPPIKKTVTLMRQLYPAMSRVEAGISRTPASLIGGLYHYLSEYPYGCSEQVASRVFANILLYNVPELHKEYALSPAKIQKAVHEGIRLLRELQNSAGGFSMWSYYGESDDLISVYVTHMLTEARKQGFAVPIEMFDQALRYIKAIAGRLPGSLQEARIKAYAIYVITQNGEITANYLPNLLTYLERYEPGWKRDITALYMAASYKMMELIPEAEQLISAYQPSQKYRFEGFFYDSLVADSVYITILSQYFPEKLKELKQEALFRVVTYLGNRNYHSFSSLHAIMAMLHYTASASKAETFKDLAILDERNISLPVKGQWVKQATLSPATKSITFLDPSGQGFFYQISSYGFDKIMPERIIQEGIEISRNYKDLEGKPVTEIPVGSEIMVELRLRSASDRMIANVAVIDLLPGGFENVETMPVEPVIAEALLPLWRPTSFSKREDRMLLFGNLFPEERVFRYKIKAVNRGTFTLPPPYAEAMYEPLVRARGLAGKIIVK